MTKNTGRSLDQNSFKIDASSGDNSTVVFNLNFEPITQNELKVFLDGQKQTSTIHYTLSGSAVTFTTAPSAGQSIEFNYIAKV